MHTKVARFRGETEQRLYAVSLWRETPFYSERERAALAWTEAVTLVSVDHVSDDVYDLALQQFTEKELVDLTLAIVAINGWNRLAIAFRTVPGTFHLRVRPSIEDAVEVASRRVAERTASGLIGTDSFERDRRARRHDHSGRPSPCTGRNRQPAPSPTTAA